MTLKEIDALLQNVRNWHRVRGSLNRGRRVTGKAPMEMGTLPQVIEALEEYRSMVRILHMRGDIHIRHLGGAVEAPTLAPIRPGNRYAHVSDCGCVNCEGGM